MNSNKLRKCEFCTYRWLSRVNNPKSCPRCKRRFDYKEAKLVLKMLGREFGCNLLREHKVEKLLEVENGGI